MRILVFFMIAMLFIPLVAVAQEDILPERSSQEDITPPVSKAPGGKEPAWGAIVATMLILGFIFLLLEITIIPGVGVAGFIGFALLAGGVVVSYIMLSTEMAVLISAISGLGLVLIVLWLIYVFPKTRFGKSFVLDAASTKEEGYVAVDDKTRYLGVEGVTSTMLRPSGFIIANDERLDVTSECSFVEKGVRVKVSKVSDGRLIVRPIED